MFLGMICIPMWNYWWGLSENQIDLLLIDQPLVVYPKDRSSKRKGKNGKFDAPAPSKLKVAEAELKWQQKYGNGQKPKLNLKAMDFGIGSAESNDKSNNK